jgi:hypothetical protein
MPLIIHILISSAKPMVSGSTGKELAILDVYAGTGTFSFLLFFFIVLDEAHRCVWLFSVSNILVKQVSVATTNQAAVRVMCDPTTVSALLVVLKHSPQ